MKCEHSPVGCPKCRMEKVMPQGSHKDYKSPKKETHAATDKLDISKILGKL